MSYRPTRHAKKTPKKGSKSPGKKVTLAPKSTFEVNGEVIQEERIRQILTELNSYYYVQVSSLKDKSLENFRELARYVEALHNTPFYPEFYQMVQEIYKCKERKGPPAIATVGAYLCGFGEDGEKCSLPIVSSMPRPNGEAICPENVIWGLYSPRTSLFRFTNLHRGGKDGSYIIHLSYPGTFPGFTETEKQILRSNGVEKIRLIAYDESTRSSQVLTDWVYLDSISIRHDKHVPHTYPKGSEPPLVSSDVEGKNAHRTPLISEKGEKTLRDSSFLGTENSSANTVIIVVLAVILGIILLFVIWRLVPLTLGPTQEGRGKSRRY